VGVASSNGVYGIARADGGRTNYMGSNQYHMFVRDNWFESFLPYSILMRPAFFKARNDTRCRNTNILRGMGEHSFVDMVMYVL